MEKVERIDANGLRHLEELDYVQAPLASLVFRDKGLRLGKFLGKFRLGDPGGLPRLD